MAWLTPQLAFLAAAIAVPALLILYFLKLRRREVEISTTLLWKKAIEDLRANAPFQRLRRNIMLLLQLLALAAALLAIAQPELRANLEGGQRFVILIDRSASMGARDGAQGGNDTRLAQAKREAREFVEAMREPGLLRSLRALGGASASDEAMLIAFDAGAQVVQPFTSNKRMLLAAIDAIEQTDAPTSLDEAMRLAGAYAQPVLREDVGLVSVATAPIHVWTDGRIADATQLKPSAETPMIYHAVGTPDARNVAITSIGAERQFDRPSRISVFVGLQATVRADLAVDVELSIDGVVAGVKRVVLPGMDESARPLDAGVVFELDQEAGALVRVRAVVPDAARAEDLLDADNSAHLAIPPAKRASVLLVSPGSLYLQYALEGLPLARLDVMSPTQFRDAASRRSDTLSIYDAVVLDGETSVSELEAIPPGRYLALGVVPPMLGVALEGDPAPTVVLDYERDHPLLRSAGLDRLTIARARSLTLSGVARPIARGERGPLIAEVSDGAVEALVLAFDPAQSDWPFDVGFIVFLAEAMQSLASGGTGALAAVPPGATGRALLPAGARNVALVEPGGGRIPVQPNDESVALFGPVRRAGLYALRWEGPATASDIALSGGAQRPVAVNLTDPFESDLRATPSLELASRSVEAARRDAQGPGRRSLWPWLLLACLGVLMVEWWVYNRKVAL